MKVSIPITKKRIKNHFTYSWWQYALLAALAIFGWNLLFTTTHYRSPENLKVEWYCDAALVATEETPSIDALMDELHKTLLSDMEEVTFTQVGMDETYGDMQLMVWASAGQGDLYTLTDTRFRSLGADGGLIDLQPYVDNGTLNIDGLDVSAGYVADAETGKQYFVGIPCDELVKLNEYAIGTTGERMCVLANCGNVENAVKLMAYLLDNMR